MFYSSFATEQAGQVTIVRPNTKCIIEDRYIQQCGDELIHLAEQSTFILLDFSSVTFMSSSFYGNLLTLQKRLQRADGRLVLCGLDEDTYGTFLRTNLDKCFNIYPDSQEALASF